MILESDKEPRAETLQRRDWLFELRSAFDSLACAPVFGLLIAVWALLFHFLGNSTIGYIKTASLFAWMDYSYSMGPDDQHGYIIPFIVIGLLFWKRRELAALPKRCWWPALALVVLSLALHAIGLLVQQARISIVALYFGVWGLVGAVWGPAVLRATFFPFCLLVFAVPLYTVVDTITFPLRRLATIITTALGNSVLGIHVRQEGTSIFDPSGRYSYEVAAACSGIRSLMAIFALTTVYAFVFFNRWWKRACILLLAFPLAVVSNVLRLLMIIVASEAFSAHAGHVVHESTWISLVPYIVAFGGVLLAGRLMREDRPVDVIEVIIPVVAACAAFIIPRQLYLKFAPVGANGPAIFTVLLIVAVIAVFLRRPRFWPQVPARSWAVGAATFAVIGASLAVLAERRASQRLSPPGVKVIAEPIYAVSATNRVLAGTNIVHLPESVLTYRSEPVPLSTIVYDWLPKDTLYGQRRYIAPDEFVIENLVVLMGADRTSIHKPQFCITGQGYRIMSEENDVIRISQPSPYDLPVKKLHFQGEKLINGDRVIVNGVFVYWFVSDRELTAEHGTRMWQMAFDLLRTGVLTRWAYVINMGFCPPGGEVAAYERIKQFIQAGLPDYQLTTGKPPVELSSLGAARE